MRAEGFREILRMAWDLTNPNRLPTNLELIKERVTIAMEQNNVSWENVTSASAIGTVLTISTRALGNQSSAPIINIDFLTQKQAKEAEIVVKVNAEATPHTIGAAPLKVATGLEFVVDL